MMWEKGKMKSDIKRLLVQIIVLFALVVGAPMFIWCLNSLPDHDTPEADRAKRYSYEKMLGIEEAAASEGIDRPVFLAWEMEDFDANGDARRASGAVDADEAAARKTAGASQQRFEAILKEGMYVEPWTVDPDAYTRIMRIDKLLSAAQRRMARVRFSGGEQYAKTRGDYRGVPIASIEAQVYEHYLTLVYVTDASHNQRLYYSEDRDVADGIVNFVRAYRNRSAD